MQNRKKHPAAVIFDLDGTVADTMDALGAAMNTAFREIGYPERTREELLGCINYGAYEFVRRAMPDSVTSLPDADERIRAAKLVYERHYDRFYLDTKTAYPGLCEVMLEMKSHGIRLGMVSNKPDRYVRGIAEQLFPAGLLDAAVGQRPELPVKPDPRSSLYVAEQLGAAPGDVLFVGDSSVDFKTAENAGFAFAGVTWGFGTREKLLAAGAPQNSIIDTPRQLAALALRLI